MTTQLFQGEDETQEERERTRMCVSVCVCLCQLPWKAVTVIKIMYAAFVAYTKLVIFKTLADQVQKKRWHRDLVSVCRLHLEVIM